MRATDQERESDAGPTDDPFPTIPHRHGTIIDDAARVA
jgi:hypothetical protein